MFSPNTHDPYFSLQKHSPHLPKEKILEKRRIFYDFYNKGVKTISNVEFTMSPYHVLWPIPASTINSNTKGHINQNKGYAGSENNIPPLETIEAN